MRDLRLLDVARGIGRMMGWRHRLFSRHRLDSAVIESIVGLPLIVLPGVFHPTLMRTGVFFASVLARESSVEGAEILDLGTGSGVCALAVAERARGVAAVDLSRTAVRCARVNTLLNGLESKIEVLHGDLFAPVGGRRFDLVLFNPPFLRGAPRGEADLAWRSVDVPERFAAGLREHLKPTGAALLLLSTFGNPADFLGPLEERGFAIAPRAHRRFTYERLSLFEVRVGPGGDPR
jgi:HemK-related putative methylase